MSGSRDLVFYRLVIGRVAADRGKTYCWRLTPLIYTESLVYLPRSLMTLLSADPGGQEDSG